MANSKLVKRNAYYKVPQYIIDEININLIKKKDIPSNVKQKAKKGVCVDGRGIVLPFSKTQPVFCFLCAVGLRQLPCGKK